MNTIYVFLYIRVFFLSLSLIDLLPPFVIDRLRFAKDQEQTMCTTRSGLDVWERGRRWFRLRNWTPSGLELRGRKKVCQILFAANEWRAVKKIQECLPAVLKGFCILQSWSQATTLNPSCAQVKCLTVLVASSDGVQPKSDGLHLVAFLLLLAMASNLLIAHGWPPT